MTPQKGHWAFGTVIDIQGAISNLSFNNMGKLLKFTRSQWLN